MNGKRRAMLSARLLPASALRRRILVIAHRMAEQVAARIENAIA
jgi:hypothetical protein